MPKFKVTKNWGKTVILKTDRTTLLLFVLLELMVYLKNHPGLDQNYQVGDSDIITVERIE